MSELSEINAKLETLPPERQEAIRAWSTADDAATDARTRRDAAARKWDDLLALFDTRRSLLERAAAGDAGAFLSYTETNDAIRQAFRAVGLAFGPAMQATAEAVTQAFTATLNGRRSPLLDAVRELRGDLVKQRDRELAPLVDECDMRRQAAEAAQRTAMQFAAAA
jgi:hypothetical protein